MADLDEFLQFSSEKNAGSKHSGSNNESDDFEQLDPYPMPEHPDEQDFLVTSNTAGKDDFFNGSHVANLHSTNRPLVTFDETSPTAPSAPPSLSPVQESMKFEDHPEFEQKYSQPGYDLEQHLREEARSQNVVPDLDFTSFEGTGTPDSTTKERHHHDSSPEFEKSEPTPSACYKPPPLVVPAPVLQECFIGDKMEAPETKAAEASPVQTPVKSGAALSSCPICAWFNPQNLDPRVVDLIYWRDPKKSGIVFGGILSVLLALTYFSLISVIAYLSLFVLTATATFRIYKNVLAAVQKTNEGHPFKQFLEMDISLSGEKINDIVETVVAHVNAIVHELRRLILVDDLVDSIKFAVVLWCFTYVGAWFNGLTLLILSFVGTFTLPKVYETNKTQIDHYIGIVSTQVNDVMSKVKAKLPVGRKPKEQ